MSRELNSVIRLVEWLLLFFIFIMFLVFIAGISQAVGSKEDPYVNVDGQRVLFVEPEKEQWMNELSSGLDTLRPEENVLDYSFAKHYVRVYNRSLQSHVTKTVYGVLVLTNLRFIFVQRYRKQAFGEYVYKKATTTTLRLIKYADCGECMLRIGTLRTPRGERS